MAQSCDRGTNNDEKGREVKEVTMWGSDIVIVTSSKVHVCDPIEYYLLFANIEYYLLFANISY